MEMPILGHRFLQNPPIYQGRRTCKTAAIVFAAVMSCAGSLAQEEADTKTVGSPQPVANDDYEDLLNNSPFTRSLNLSDTLSLTGVAHLGDQSMITLFDRKSKETHVVSGDNNSLGWKLVEISPDDDLQSMTAKISVNGGEMITVRFDEKQLNPEPRRSTPGVKVPTGPDQRSKPTDEERRKFGEYVKKRMGKMTETQRKRVGEIMREKMKANPNITDRQKGETFVRILDYVEKGGK
ncbi:MAG: hypothetical protein AAGH89_02755 [Verrucomicrobiota bacterium]